MTAGMLNINPFLEKLGKMAQFTGEELKDVMKQEATLAIYNGGKVPGVINITPPFSAQARDGNSALLRAQASIDRDLSGVFMPVTIKGERKIPHLFGNKNPNVGRKPPYVVPTKERWPNVAEIVKRRWKSKNTSGSKRMTRGQKSLYYVDANKLSIERRESYAMIGLACACWYLAAIQAGLTPRGVPAWVKRHTSAFGAGAIDVTATSIRITLSSSLPYNTALMMQDKMTRVLGYREKALERRLPYILAAAARKAKLNAA